MKIFKKTVQKQLTQNSRSDLEWWVWIAWWLLFCIRYSRLYWVYHKKHEILTTNPPFHIYFNRINNRLVFKIKNGCKLELQTPETMKLFGSTKKLIKRTQKNGESVSSIEVVEIVLVQWNPVDNQYQPKSEVLHTLRPIKYYLYLLNVESSNLAFLKTYTLSLMMYQ